MGYFWNRRGSCSAGTPLPFVGDGDRDVNPGAFRRDPDRGRFRRVPGGVGEQVVQHLDDALRVGHYPRQVGWKIDQYVVAGSAAREGGPRPLQQRADLQGFRGDRERSGVDASRIEQIGEQVAHLVGLLVDNAMKLAQLRRVQGPGRAEQRAGGALDRQKRCPQFVADHAQEVGPQPVQLAKRLEVLQRDDHGLHRAVLRADGRHVHQRS